MLTSSRWELSTLIIITRNENLLNFLNLSVSAWFPRRLNWFNILMHDVLINMIWKLIQLGEKESRYPNFPPTPPLKWFSFCHFMIKIANRWLDKSFILIILLLFFKQSQMDDKDRTIRIQQNMLEQYEKDKIKVVESNAPLQDVNVVETATSATQTERVSLISKFFLCL